MLAQLRSPGSGLTQGGREAALHPALPAVLRSLISTAPNKQPSPSAKKFASRLHPLAAGTLTRGEPPQDGALAPRAPRRSRAGERPWRPRVPSPAAPRRFPQLSAWHRGVPWGFCRGFLFLSLFDFFFPNPSQRQREELRRGPRGREEEAAQRWGLRGTFSGQLSAPSPGHSVAHTSPLGAAGAPLRMLMRAERLWQDRIRERILGGSLASG